MKLTRLSLMMVILVLLFAIVLPASAQTAQARTHTVQPGETLLSIAIKYGVTVEQIAFANGITNPNLIYAGQVLIIPSTGSGGTGTQITYTVVAGDTLYFIARRFGTTIQAIVDLNGIADPNSIDVGQVLKIPTSSSAPTATTAPTSPGSLPTSAATTAPTTTITYVVKAGDTLGRIALSFGTTYQQIALLNNLSDPNLIFPGQTLIIRQGTVSAATPTQPPATATLAPTATLKPATATLSAPPATVIASPTGAIIPTSTLIPPESPTTEGTLPPGFQTPTAIVSGTQVPVDATNRLQNSGFEDPAPSGAASTLQISSGWDAFFCAQPYTSTDCPAERQGTGNPPDLLMSQPVFQTTTAPTRIAAGAQAQSWLCPFQVCQGGVFQTVDTIAGTTCEAGASVQSWSTNDLLGISSALNTFDDRSNSTWFIKVDLNGGVDAFSDTVISSRGFGYDDGIYDHYAPISFTFTVTSTQTTVFFENLRLWPFVHNDSFIDDAYVRCTEP